MGVHSTGREGRVAMYDSVTGIAFGPTFDTQDEMDSFDEYVRTVIGEELRSIGPARMEVTHRQWLNAVASGAWSNDGS